MWNFEKLMNAGKRMSTEVVVHLLAQGGNYSFGTGESEEDTVR